jgi:hypothetical protein
MSESWLRQPKILTFPSPITTFSTKIELPKGVELQSTAATACRGMSCYPGLYPNSSSFYI